MEPRRRRRRQIFFFFFFLLLLKQRARRRRRSALPNEFFRFDLDSWSDERCLALTRFTKLELRSIIPLLQLQDVRWRFDLRPAPELAVAHLLTRQAAPEKLWRLSSLFGRSSAYLSTIYNDLNTYLARRFGGIVEFHPRLRDYELLRIWGETVGERSGYGRDRIWGFIDGTFRPMARPIVNESRHYTGHKKRHGIRFQGVATPDGLISSLMGPYPANRNDWWIYSDSGLGDRMREIYGERETLYLYGDPAYHHSYGILAPYPIRQRTLEQHRLNVAMSRCRIHVENCFGKISNLWQSHQMPSRLQSLNSPVAAYYIVAVLLTNIFTCIRGNETIFGLKPPSLHDYLHPQGEVPSPRDLDGSPREARLPSFSPLDEAPHAGQSPSPPRLPSPLRQ